MSRSITTVGDAMQASGGFATRLLFMALSLSDASAVQDFANGATHSPTNRTMLRRDHGSLAAPGTTQIQPQGFVVVVPGFGDRKRGQLLRDNIKWLIKQNVYFDCTIYVYQPAVSFPLNASDYTPCRLVRHEGKWMDHIQAFSLEASDKQWVVHMLDGIEVTDNVNLTKIVEIMKLNRLSHAAPSLESSPLYKTQIQHASKGGRLVNFIELQFDVFSRDYFACLQKNIKNNSYGWGVDRILPVVCPGALGIIDEMLVRKKFNLSYDRGKAYSEEQHFYEKFPEEVRKRMTFNQTIGMLRPVGLPSDDFSIWRDGSQTRPAPSFKFMRS